MDSNYTTTTPQPIIQITWFYTVFYDDWSASMFGVLLLFLSVTALLGVYCRKSNPNPYNHVPSRV